VEVMLQMNARACAYVQDEGGGGGVGVQVLK